MKITDYNSTAMDYFSKKTTVNTSSFSTEINTDTVSDPMTYYRNLCAEFSDITFRLDDVSRVDDASQPYHLGYNNSMNQVGENFGQHGTCSISIDVSVIENMQKDPEYERRVKGIIMDSYNRYSEFESNALADGFYYVSVAIEDEGGEARRAIAQSRMPYSTEEEVIELWKENESTNQLVRKVEECKNSLADFYLQMLEKSEQKRETLRLNQIFDKDLDAD